MKEDNDNNIYKKKEDFMTIKRKIRHVIVFLLMIISFNSFFIISNAAAKDTAAGDCVSYAKARFREYWGFDLHRTGTYGGYAGAQAYYYNAASWGDQVSAMPAAGALAIWGDSTYGHVGFVEQVSGNSVFISEGGFNGGYREQWRDLSSMNNPNQTFLGFVYVAGCSISQSSSNTWNGLSPVNIGNDVYGVIIRNDGWAHLGNDNGNVEVTGVQQDGSDVWHFVRQSDGSYFIYNCKDTNRVLDIYDNGITVETTAFIYNGGYNQHWYIYGPRNGEFILRSKYSDKVLTAPATTAGTNVYMSTYVNDVSQKMTIYEIHHAGAPTLSVTPGTDMSDTVFTWKQGLDNTKYSLRIFKTVGNTTSWYKDVWTTELSAGLTLPEGQYQAYVDGCNAFSYAASNTVTFTVKKATNLNGWVDSNGTSYYYQNNQKYTGWRQDPNYQWHYFKDGLQVRGWEYISGKWYYFSDSTTMVEGWQRIDGKTYLFDSSGAMVTGWRNGICWQYFAPSGELVTGWYQVSGIWYYFDGNGTMLTGWQLISGTWYYFNGSGAMLTGWQAIGGTWYYFNGSGAMVTGWQVIGGKWYYFHGSGAMAANQWVGNYYLQSDGSMATNRWIGRYYVGADGCWIP